MVSAIVSHRVTRTRHGAEVGTVSTSLVGSNPRGDNDAHHVMPPPGRVTIDLMIERGFSGDVRGVELNVHFRAQV